jgi:hypothetical protein
MQCSIRMFVLLPVALLVSTILGAPPAQALTKDELQCQASISAEGRAFAKQHDKLIFDCDTTIAKGKDCKEDKRDAKLAKALGSLTRHITKDCKDVDLGNLGLPGACTDPDGGDFSIQNLIDCIANEINNDDTEGNVFPNLQQLEHPELRCQSTIAGAARTFVNRKLRARTHCLLQQLQGKLSSSVDCRAEVILTPGTTGDAKTDKLLHKAGDKFTDQISRRCADVALETLGFPGICTDPDGASFSVENLIGCLLPLLEARVDELVNKQFPPAGATPTPTATPTGVVGTPTETASGATPTETAAVATPTETAAVATPTETAPGATPTETAAGATPTATAAVATPTATAAVATPTATAAGATPTATAAGATPTETAAGATPTETAAGATPTETAAGATPTETAAGTTPTPQGTPAAQAPVVLGAAANFAVLAGSTVTNTLIGVTTITGDLGVSPGTAVTGFPPGVVTGATHAGDATAAQAQLDLTTAFNDAAGRTVGAVTVAGNLGGQTLTPGLYKSTSSLEISSGDLTLDAQGDTNAVFIFQMASTLTTTTGRQVILSGGAKAANIVWQVGSSATLGTTSVFAGTILADQKISLTTGATLDGRALARSAEVTLDANSVTIPAP